MIFYKRKFLVLIFGFFIISNFSYAQEEINKDNSHNINPTINMCPLGIALGIYSANYEYLINNYHGLVARLDYEAIHKTYSDANINSDGKAAIIN